MAEKSYLDSLFQTTAKMQASDLHLVVDEPPIIRIQGALKPIKGESDLKAKTLLAELKKIFVPANMDRYMQRNDLDFSYQISGGERFRVNVYWERGRPALSARYIPAVIPTLEEVDAPEAVLEFLGLTQGFVLITGPTGTGKSTLLASMIEQINQTRNECIITLEDPIEFLFKPKKCLVSQRELGTDFGSFADGLKHVFRQDPDIIMVGEMRDPETISTALTLAETGHLVFATLHTNSAAQTIERIIDTFPGIQQQQIRQQLSLVLRGVISQVLVPKLDGKLTPVHEVLMNTHAVANIIREGRTEQLPNVILTSDDAHMVSFDQELHWLVKQKMISAEVAKAHARNPKEF